MNKQDKFKCKHIKCDMDGNYCGINKGKGYNHCVLPHYQDSCEYYEEENTTNKQIEEIEITENAIRKYIESDKVYMLNDELELLIQSLGYQKVDKDSVIISKEQYSKLLNNQTTVISIDENLKKEYEYELKQARKETAKDYHEKMRKVIHERDYISGYAEIGLQEENNEIAKQYGVEIKNG